MRRPRAPVPSALPSPAAPSQEALSYIEILNSANQVALMQTEDAKQETEAAKQEAEASKKETQAAKQEAQAAKNEAKAAKTEAKAAAKKQKAHQKSRNEALVMIEALLARLDVEIPLAEARDAAAAAEAQAKLRQANDTIDVGLFRHVLGVVGKGWSTEQDVKSYDEFVQRWKGLVGASQERVHDRDEKIKALEEEEITGLKADSKYESLRRASGLGSMEEAKLKAIVLLRIL